MRADEPARILPPHLAIPKWCELHSQRYYKNRQDLSFPLSLSPIGFFGVWFRVLGVCRLERTDSFGDVRQEEWERRVSLVIIT
mmetsp:Transcript_41997/g.61718  ORF Transcript_41997/g.61718 Transcript_41997/m.61718 type:complete len:83 (+) Transcript_41997:625-873(+)